MRPTEDAAATTPAQQRTDVAAALAMVAAVALPLAVRRRWPVAVLCVVAALHVAHQARGVLEPYVTSIALYLAVHTVGARVGDRRVTTVVASVVALLLFFTVFGSGCRIAQSVTEEKASRVVALLVAAVPVRALLGGKVAGASVLAVGQVVVVLAGGLLVLAATGQGSLLATVAPAGGWSLVLSLVGFAMLSTLWAAAGALAARIEDLQSTTVPTQTLGLPRPSSASA